MTAALCMRFLMHSQASCLEQSRPACANGVVQTVVTVACDADKAQTGERSRNADGTLSGADRSTARDAEFWDQEDVYR